MLFWEKTKHLQRGNTGGTYDGVQVGIYVEFLAWRAQRFVLAGEADRLSTFPVFDGDVEALARVSQQAQAARVAAAS